MALLLPVFPAVGANPISIEEEKPKAFAELLSAARKAATGIRRSLCWSPKSPITSTLGLLCILQGMDHVGRKRDIDSGIVWYERAVKAYTMGNIWGGVGHAYALLGIALMQKAKLEGKEYADLLGSFRKAYVAYTEIGDMENAKRVMALNKDALLRFTSAGAVKNQIEEIPFIADTSTSMMLEDDAAKIAILHAGLSFDKLGKLGEAPRFGHVPYPLLIEYYRRIKREGIAQQLAKWAVHVNRVMVSKWLEIHREGDHDRELLDRAVLMIRKAAMDPGFHREFVIQPRGAERDDPQRKYGTVSPAGIVHVLRPLDQVSGSLALSKPPPMVETEDERTMLEAELRRRVTEDNESALFYEAWRRQSDHSAGGKRGNRWHPTARLSNVLRVSKDILEGNALPPKYFDADGRLLLRGVERAVDLALDNTVGPDWRAGITREIAEEEVVADELVDVVESVEFAEPKDALVYCIDTGKVRFEGWDDKSDAQKEAIMTRIRYAMYDENRAMQEGRRRRTFIFRKTAAASLDVNLTVLKRVADKVMMSVEVERVISEKYPAMKSLDLTLILTGKYPSSKVRRTEEVWPKLSGVMGALDEMSSGQAYSEGGRLREDVVIEVYESLLVKEILQGRFLEFMGLGDDAGKKVVEAVAGILRRGENASRVVVDGQLNPALVIEAYRDVIAGRSKSTDFSPRAGGRAGDDDDLDISEEREGPTTDVDPAEIEGGDKK